jgi:hypothetical protein
MKEENLIDIHKRAEQNLTQLSNTEEYVQELNNNSNNDVKTIDYSKKISIIFYVSICFSTLIVFLIYYNYMRNRCQNYSVIRSQLSH